MTTPKFVFVDDPVLYSEDPSNSVETGEFRLFQDGDLVFSSLYSGVPKFDVSQLIKSYLPAIKPAHLCPLAPGTPLRRVITDSELTRFHTFGISTDTYENQEEFIAIPGEVGYTALVMSRRKNIDVFENLYLARGCCFFMSRRSDWTITLPENELYPLHFITRSSDNFEIAAIKHNVSIGFEADERGVFALDIQELRYLFLERFGVIPAVFSIKVDGLHCCYIVVETSAKPSFGHLVFRTGLGNFDSIAIAEEVLEAPVWDDSETNFKSYNEETGYFLSNAKQREATRVFTVNIDCPGKRSALLAELLSSDEIYLNLLDGTSVPVLPTGDPELALWNNKTTPSSATIKLKAIAPGVATVWMPAE